MKTVVIGGGLSGLVVAYELTKMGKEVVVLEKEKELGGVLGSFKIGNYYIEKFYHHIFGGDKEFIGMVDDLGLKNKFRFRGASTAFLYGDGFFELSAPQDLLFFKPLSLVDKLKLGILLLNMKMVKDFKKYDNISAAEYITENAGKNVFEKFFRPMLKSKYQDNFDEISAAWFIERMKTRSKRSFSGESLGYINGGFHFFIEKLVEEIKKNSGIIKTNVRVKEIKVKNNKVDGVLFDSEEIKTNEVVSTIPPKELTKIIKLKGDYGKKLNSLDYQGCISVLFGFKKKITDYYWTNIVRDDIIFGAIIEHTNFQPLSAYGEHIVYLASYPERNSWLWKLSDDKIFKIYFQDLKKIFPNLKEDDVKWKKVIRERNGGLVYKRGIKSNILAYQTPIKGLFICGMFNSFPDRNIDTSIKVSEECVRVMGGEKL